MACVQRYKRVKPLAADAAHIILAHITQAGITTAVAWGFKQMVLPGVVPATAPREG